MGRFFYGYFEEDMMSKHSLFEI